MKLPFILDGAIGSNLIASGMEAGQEPADFVVKNPDVIKKLTLDYINAGAEAILTPTFGVNPHKFGDRCVELNRTLVSLTKKTAKDSGKAVKIMSDISPTGLFMPPMGNASFDDIYNAFAVQIRIFEEESIDILSFMTMYSLAEARIALLACREISKKPVFASMTVNSNGRTMTGSDLCASVWLLGAMGASSVGINCSSGPEDMTEHIKRAFEIAEKPIYCKPNAGTDAEHYLTPSDFAEKMNILLLSGASVVGGCCGTTPDYIKELCKTAEKHDSSYYSDKIETNRQNRLSTGKIFAATEKSLHIYAGMPTLAPITDPESFSEDFYDFDPDEFDAAHIAVESIADAEMLLSTAGLCDIPLCVSCGDRDTLEYFVRRCCGQVLIHPDCALNAYDKKLFTEKYASLIM